ncbi:MAG TPA: hypothetical protein VGN18_18550 [Jatrophihabitans sp.]|uniref:hypothetical protein n=1 Tax=Jatrophihabitans sp. TaxID=1932789 RepID=UPI002DFFDC12|nr:hypothetical protein [Jatrophihabitans sp.]
MLPAVGGTVDGLSRFSGRLQVTERARSVIRNLYRMNGPQCLVLCWPSGVAHLPSALHEGGPFDVIIGHVAGCPIYADLRQLALFRERRITLDAPERVISPRPPLLKVIGAMPGPSRTALVGSAR